MRILSRLHRDTRGAMGILLLMVLWALICLLGLLWNSAEYAARREHVQNASDSSAMAAATWMSRATNAVCALNMALCQDASAEVVYRSVAPTDQAVRAELEKEKNDVVAMLNGTDPGYDQIRQAIQKDLANVDLENGLLVAAQQDVSSSMAGGTYPDAQTQQDFYKHVRQAGEAIGWVQDTYVNGQAPTVAGRPGPPGINGQGLRTLVDQWNQQPTDRPELLLVYRALTGTDYAGDAPLPGWRPVGELVVLGQFETRTAPGQGPEVPGNIANHETLLCTDMKAVVDATPTATETQRAKMAALHACQVVLATPEADAKTSRPLQIQAPLKLASDVPAVTDHQDIIRQRFPAEAAAAQPAVSLSVIIDPINVHTHENRIWYPPVKQPMPGDILSKYPGVPATVEIKCDAPDGWGHMYGAPLEHYVTDRVWNDQKGLEAYMTQIDQIRSDLAAQLRVVRQLPAQLTTPLPASIKDSQPNAQGVVENIPVLPTLNGPTDTTMRAKVVVYNFHAGRYTQAVSALRWDIENAAGYFQRFVTAFAADTWHRQIELFRLQVLETLGQKKEFYVLASYALQPIPDWAQSGMQQATTTRVRDIIVAANVDVIQPGINEALANADPLGYKSFFPPGQFLHAYLLMMYGGDAATIAQRVATDGANVASPLIAQEWTSRPWPYEITPPTETVPPVRGLGKPDRLHWFTVMGGAMTTSDTAPRLMLQAVFGQGGKGLAAYGQAETFNWNEFADAYGGADRYDQVTDLPTGSYSWWGNSPPIVGCPRMWRLCTVGGWNWQPRLSFSDGLVDTFANNPDFVQVMNAAGITRFKAEDTLLITH